MSRWIALGAVVVVVIALVFVIGFGSNDEVQLTAADNGSELVLEEGDTMVVTLDSNPSTGYSWQVAGGTDSVLQLVGEPEFRQKSNALGASGMEVFRFEAVGSGSTELHLAYQRPWEKDVEPVEEFSINVTVK